MFWLSRGLASPKRTGGFGEKSILHLLMVKLARVMAILGGLVLIALVLVTCVSVLGRSANTLGHTPWLESLVEPLASLLKRLGPVRGDFELVEAGVAFAIFAFFPWCQLKQGHATVDLVTNHLPEPVRRLLVTLWEILLSAIIVLITWRLMVGASDKFSNGETTFLLQFPVWWAFVTCSVAAVAASIVSVYVAVTRVRELFGNTDLLEHEAGADH